MRRSADLRGMTRPKPPATPQLAREDLQQKVSYRNSDAADDLAPNVASKVIPNNQQQKQDRQAISLQRCENRTPKWWEHRDENARSVEWRQGNHVERREAEVDEDE